MFVVSVAVDLLRFITVILFCLGDSYLLLNRGFFSPRGNSALWLIRSYTIQIKLLIKAESCAPFTPRGGRIWFTGTGISTPQLCAGELNAVRNERVSDISFKKKEKKKMDFPTQR